MQSPDGPGAKGGNIYPMAPCILWSKEILECQSACISVVCAFGGWLGSEEVSRGASYRHRRGASGGGECPRLGKVHLGSARVHTVLEQAASGLRGSGGPTVPPTELSIAPVTGICT